ncbi:unnamed protein product, partial [Mesorhabditis belari]|uniref:Uncharacterized protein n=1 Tax=Mesorhabditis belari TaxID=2138241 RepID=A0AAF3EUH7_9BILA
MSGNPTLKCLNTIVATCLCSSFHLGFLFMTWSSASLWVGLKEQLYHMLSPDFDTSTEEIARGLLSSLLIFGFALGCFLYSIRSLKCSKLWGLRISSLISAICIFFGSFEETYSLALPLSRYFTGTALAFSIGYGTEFITEILPTHFQWVAVPLQVSFAIVGCFMSSVLTFFNLLNSLDQLVMTLRIQGTILFLALLFLLWAEESPVHLCKKGELKRCASSISVYNDTPLAYSVFQNIQDDTIEKKFNRSALRKHLFPVFCLLSVAFSGGPILLLYPNVYLHSIRDYQDVSSVLLQSANLMCMTRVAAALIVAFMALFARREIAYSKPRVAVCYLVSLVALSVLVFLPMTTGAILRMILVILQVITLGENSATLTIELFCALAYLTRESRRSTAASIGFGCVIFAAYIASFPFVMDPSDNKILSAYLLVPTAVCWPVMMFLLPRATPRAPKPKEDEKNLTLTDRMKRNAIGTVHAFAGL